MTVVIAMWSGPRNISTTMMRAFENRPDTDVLDEPFYGLYLARSGAIHPFREETLKVRPATIKGVLDLIDREARAPQLFLKHIAYHLPAEADLSFIDRWRNFLLIRDPRAMIASFARKLDDVAPIIRSYEVERAILDRLHARGAPCPIVDADDILRAPETMLRTLCAALDIAFDASMLSWPSGLRRSDGPWAPHWYDAVAASTGFRPYVEKKPSFPEDLQNEAAAALEHYQWLHALRLRP